MEYPSYEEKKMSRKWRLVLLVTLLATIGAFVPPILGAFLLKKPFVILSGAEWVTIISMCFGLYVGGNVYQKGVELKATTTPSPHSASAKPEEKKDDDEKHA